MDKQDTQHINQIASSVADIVRLSLNESFRKECYSAMGVTNTPSLEKKLQAALQDTLLSKVKKETPRSFKNMQKQQISANQIAVLPKPYSQNGSFSEHNLSLL